VNPIAMGRIPPDFLFKAINRPLKKMGATFSTQILHTEGCFWVLGAQTVGATGGKR